MYIEQVFRYTELRQIALTDEHLQWLCWSFFYARVQLYKPRIFIFDGSLNFKLLLLRSYTDGQNEFLTERSPMMERYFEAINFWKISKFIFSEDSRLWYGNIVTLLLIRVFDNESLINVWWLVLTDFHSKFYITRYNL